jgi:hypothetical protein
LCAAAENLHRLNRAVEHALRRSHLRTCTYRAQRTSEAARSGRLRTPIQSYSHSVPSSR